MSDRTPEEREELLRELQHAGAHLSREQSSIDKNLDRAEKIIKWLWALGGVIAMGSLWAGKIQWDYASLEKDVAKNTAKIEEYHKDIDAMRELARAKKEADGLLFQTMQFTIESNKKENLAQVVSLRDDINTFKSLLPELTEIIVMRRYGISNKEDYQKTHGVAAPDFSPTTRPK